MRRNANAQRSARDSRESREAIERHWAVAALPAEERTRALAAAERAWEALDLELADAAPLARRLSTTERELVERTADAYERAALDRVEVLLADDATPTDETRTELRLAAAHAFKLRRVLPPPDDEASAAYHALRVAAIALVADQLAAFARWRASAASRLPLETPPTLPWDATMRRAVTRVFLDLVEHSDRSDAVEESFEVLGALRELRDVRENEFLSALPTADAEYGRHALVVLYTLANAAATLVVHARRGPFVETLPRLAHDFTRLRQSAIGPLDRLVPWLHLASELVAARQGMQIPLPGLLA
ncbi:MAG TPA: hypothetical protein VEA99_01265 [Gemmatimonadaceae bacterium]|nr:hypothetical protein [Gemmatimonadaceae bacterium]